MRPKVILVVVALAFGLFGGIALVSSVLRPKPPRLSASTASSPAVLPPNREPQIARRTAPSIAVDPAPHDLTVIPHPPVLSRDQAHADFVEKRIDELLGLARTDDPVAHAAILLELTNDDKEIRQAALECLVQAHDPIAVPRLRELLQAAVDPEEKAALRAAIRSINLPSLIDTIAADRQREKPTPGN